MLLLLLKLDWLDLLLDNPLLLLLPLVPLLELDGSTLKDVVGLAGWGGGTNSAGGNNCAGGGDRLLGGESPT